MSTTLEPSREKKAGFIGASLSGIFISGLQEQIASSENDLESKLKFWQFGLDLIQKLEQGRYAQDEAEFDRPYERLLISLLAIGFGLKEDIEDPKIVEHINANLENLTSKYITFKMPSLEGKPNRLLNLVAS